MNRIISTCLALCSCLAVTGCVSGPARDLARAKREFAEQIASRRENKRTSMNLYRQAMLSEQAGDSSQAVRLLEQAVKADDTNAYAWMALGEAAYRQERMYDAARAFDKAAKLEPDRWEPHYNSGIVLEEAGLFEEAIQEYRMALDLSPSRLEVMENLARVYVRTNNREAAEPLLRRAVAQEGRPQWRRWLKSQLQLTGGRTSLGADQSDGLREVSDVNETSVGEGG